MNSLKTELISKHFDHTLFKIFIFESMFQILLDGKQNVALFAKIQYLFQILIIGVCCIFLSEWGTVCSVSVYCFLSEIK